jgi:hypothetical protein
MIRNAGILWIALAATGCDGGDPSRWPGGMQHPNSAIVLTAATDAPAIDGVLAEPPWETAARVTRFIDGDGKPADPPTVARLTYDRGALYVAFTCLEPRMANLVTEARRKDDAVEQDDSVTVILVPDVAGSENLRSFSVSAAGIQKDGDDDGPAWDWNWPARVVRDFDRYHVELAIPFDALGAHPAAGDSWRILLVRNIWTAEKPRTATNVFVGPDMLNVQEYANLLFR